MTACRNVLAMPQRLELAGADASLMAIVSLRIGRSRARPHTVADFFAGQRWNRGGHVAAA